MVLSAVAFLYALKMKHNFARLSSWYNLWSAERYFIRHTLSSNFITYVKLVSAFVPAVFLSRCLGCTTDRISQTPRAINQSVYIILLYSRQKGRPREKRKEKKSVIFVTGKDISLSVLLKEHKMNPTDNDVQNYSGITRVFACLFSNIMITFEHKYPRVVFRDSFRTKRERKDEKMCIVMRRKKNRKKKNHTHKKNPLRLTVCRWQWWWR